MFCDGWMYVSTQCLTLLSAQFMLGKFNDFLWESAWNMLSGNRARYSMNSFFIPLKEIKIEVDRDVNRDFHNSLTVFHCRVLMGFKE